MVYTSFRAQIAVKKYMGQTARSFYHRHTEHFEI